MRERSSFVKNKPGVGVLRGQIQVMQHRDDGGAAIRQRTSCLEQVVLVFQIETGNRLIEKQEVILGTVVDLGQDTCPVSALLLAARELRNRAARESVHPRHLHGAPCGLKGNRTPTPGRLGTQQNDFFHRERQPAIGLLREKRPVASQFVRPNA